MAILVKQVFNFSIENALDCLDKGEVVSLTSPSLLCLDNFGKKSNYNFASLSSK